MHKQSKSSQAKAKDRKQITQSRKQKHMPSTDQGKYQSKANQNKSQQKQKGKHRKGNATQCNAKQRNARHSNLKQRKAKESNAQSNAEQNNCEQRGSKAKQSQAKPIKASTRKKSKAGGGRGTTQQREAGTPPHRLTKQAQHSTRLQEEARYRS